MRLSSLSGRIARRYLKAGKSSGAVSAISLISVAGVAVATAAIVCVLSVFNGFRSLLVEKLDILSPDITIVPAKGKTFADADSILTRIKGVEGIALAMPSVTDNALAIVGGLEMPVTLRGVDFTAFPQLTSIDSIMLGGTRLAGYAPDEVAVAVGVASQLGIREADEPMLLFAPRREGRVNLANPLSSFITDSVSVADVYRAMQSDYDEKDVICDISLARDLFQYDNEATSIDILLRSGTNPERVVTELTPLLGPEAIVKDRLRQQAICFRMIAIEKWVTFLLLIFILIIASFNIISTLCMLIIEKQPSMRILSALGMERGRIGSIFRWESMLVTLAGGVAGILLGLGLCLLQQHYGLIKLGGDPSALVIPAYPVKVEWGDIPIAFAPVLLIGIATAATSYAFARSRIHA